MADADAQSAPAANGNGAPKRRGKTKRKHTVGKVLLATTLVLALGTGLSVVYLYRHLNGNLDVIDVTDQLENRPDKERAEGPAEPLNVLVMGSDDRDGEGNNIDNQELGSNDRSDTTILMHLSADRQRAYGISIPRDSLVTRPDCEGENGETIPGGERVFWNEAFALGGPACTIQQFEQITGVYVDHYVVVDFAGFEGMVDAIGGVPVCIPEDIYDPTHGINIPAGTREIEGREALNYVRARYTLGDGSDLGRIKRQQAFIAAMVNKVMSAGTLARFDRLVGFLDAATASLQTDLESVVKIARIGMGFQGIGMDNIQFVTVPWEYDEIDPNRVAWKPEADKLWEKIAADEPLTKRLTSDAITAAAPPGQKPKKDPSAGPSGGPSAEPSTEPSTTPEPDQEAAAQAAANGLCA
ncbi:LCP family protein [Nocardioides sp. GCM10027113]|uniref:LCP family protein n=1 Tax=unclassified Nocardioides TaxID=2615069 RepID=UPI00361D7485